MTMRDEAPGPPSCPICATRDEVRREHGRYVCFSCWTVFTGEQGEWERSREQRERFAALRATSEERNPV